MTEIIDIKVSGDLVKFDICSNGIDLVKTPIVPYQKTAPLGGLQELSVISGEAYKLQIPVKEKNYENLGVGYCRG